MKTKLLLLAFTISALLFSINTNAQTTLTSGDIAVIYHLSETSTTPQGTTTNVDRIGLVLLTDIEVGTTFKVTENGSNNGTSIELDEGVIIFTAQDTHTAGTVIDLVSKDQLGQGRTSNIPLITDGNPSADYAVSTAGDQTIVYTGDENSPTFIYSAFFDGTSWDSFADCAGNCSGTESVEPSSGVTFAFGATATGEYDNNWYTGPTTFATPAEGLAAINNPANWAGENTNIGTGEVAANAIVASGFTFTTLSIDSYNLEATISLYPNPANNYITVSNTDKVSEVVIFDITGKEVIKTNLVNNQVDISKLNSGMYLVNLIGNDINVVKKLMKK